MLTPIGLGGVSVQTRTDGLGSGLGSHQAG